MWARASRPVQRTLPPSRPAHATSTYPKHEYGVWYPSNYPKNDCGTTRPLDLPQERFCCTLPSTYPKNDCGAFDPSTYPKNVAATIALSAAARDLIHAPATLAMWSSWRAPAEVSPEFFFLCLGFTSSQPAKSCSTYPKNGFGCARSPRLTLRTVLPYERSSTYPMNGLTL